MKNVMMSIILILGVSISSSSSVSAQDVDGEFVYGVRFENGEGFTDIVEKDIIAEIPGVESWTVFMYQYLLEDGILDTYWEFIPNGKEDETFVIKEGAMLVSMKKENGRGVELAAFYSKRGLYGGTIESREKDNGRVSLRLIDFNSGDIIIIEELDIEDVYDKEDGDKFRVEWKYARNGERYKDLSIN